LQDAINEKDNGVSLSVHPLVCLSAQRNKLLTWYAGKHDT